jgi:hypothetical protein
MILLLLLACSRTPPPIPSEWENYHIYQKNWGANKSCVTAASLTALRVVAPERWYPTPSFNAFDFTVRESQGLDRDTPMRFSGVYRSFDEINGKRLFGVDEMMDSVQSGVPVLATVKTTHPKSTHGIVVLAYDSRSNMWLVSDPDRPKMDWRSDDDLRGQLTLEYAGMSSIEWKIAE